MKAAKTRDARESVFTVGDGPVMRLSFRKTEYKVDVVQVCFGRSPGEPWHLWFVVVNGYRVRKDGSLGETRHEERFWQTNIPAWLREFANQRVAEVVA